jgi:hypothetical protein
MRHHGQPAHDIRLGDDGAWIVERDEKDIDEDDHTACDADLGIPPEEVDFMMVYEAMLAADAAQAAAATADADADADADAAVAAAAVVVSEDAETGESVDAIQEGEEAVVDCDAEILRL